jgi:hypothetical protein
VPAASRSGKNKSALRLQDFEDDVNLRNILFLIGIHQ